MANTTTELFDNRAYLCTGLALTQEGTLPEWIPLIPPGEEIIALDGRKYTNTDPEGIVFAFNADPRDLPVDINHSEELKAPKGEPSPAQGWVDRMEVRDGGAVWGHLKEWTRSGAKVLVAKEYRYVSPAFLFDKAKNIVRILSAGLVNRPAFDMPAIAQAQSIIKKDKTMDPKILEVLGLAADASVEDILAAVEALKKPLSDPSAEIKVAHDERDALKADLAATQIELVNARKANPSLDKFVPRADYDAAVSRAVAAEEKVSQAEAAALAAEIVAVVDAAQKEGKVQPSTRQYYLDSCAEEGGLERFKEFVKVATPICDPSSLEGRTPPNVTNKALSAEERDVVVKMGLTEDEFRAGAED